MGIYDLEGLIGREDNSYLYVVLTAALIETVMLLFVGMKSSKFLEFLSIFTSLVFSLCLVHGFCGGYQFETSKLAIETIGRMVAGFIMTLVIIKFNQFSRNDLFKHIKEIFELKDEFKEILDNLEESIIILENFKVDFVNDKFLSEFHTKFKDVTI